MSLSDVRFMGRAAARGLRPDPLLTVSEHADRHRVLSARASAEPGRWRTSRTPYLREIMDALSSTDRTSEVVFVAGAQVGKTETGGNWIHYVIDVAPGPMLAIQPTVDIAKRYSKQRLAPMIEESPNLRGKVKESRSRDSGNTLLSKEFPGGILMLAGANSAAGLRSMPVRYVFADEIDAYPGDVEGEGDPIELATARTRTFSRRKVLLTSTPTIQGQSRIWQAWEESDQRRYLVPCPDCGHRQPITWPQIRYDPAAIDAGVVLICEACGVGIEERHKPRMLAAGEWVPTNPGARARGYHVSSLYSPLGWFSWADAARQHERAQGSDEKTRVFVNTVLGEPYQESAEVPDWEALYRRREAYPRGAVPEGGGLVVTCGVDVQRDRIELEFVAWGPRMESWSLDYVVLPGDTGTIQTDEGKECVWRRLAAELRRTFPKAGGGELGLAKVAVDSSDQTQTVYLWVRLQRDPRIMAIKGRDQLTTVLGVPTPQDVTVRGKKVARGIRLWPVGVSVAKTELYGWLRADPPLLPGDQHPYGFCHFPEYPESWFLGLTAEELRRKLLRGFPKYEWEKVRDRNEPLDCRVYARAAAAALAVDRWPEEEWERRAAVLRQEAPVEVTRTPAPAVAGPTAPEPQRAGGITRRRGGWLRR